LVVLFLERERLEKGILPLELPDEPLSLLEESLSVLEEPLAEDSPDASPDASPEVEALLSPVALPLLSAEALPLPEEDEVALPPWVLETMKAAPSWVSPLLLSTGVSRKFSKEENRTNEPSVSQMGRRDSERARANAIARDAEALDFALIQAASSRA
jgi:hypothetical protein